MILGLVGFSLGVVVGFVVAICRTELIEAKNKLVGKLNKEFEKE